MPAEVIELSYRGRICRFDGEPADLGTAVRADSVVHVLPAVSGG